jgi:Leucine Rich repeat
MSDVRWKAQLDRVLRNGEKNLDLRGEALGDLGVGKLVGKLVKKKNENNVGELLLDFCEIGDAGAESLAALLRSNPPALYDVRLNNNKITQQGIRALAESLKQNRTLKSIDLFLNPGFDVPGLGLEPLHDDGDLDPSMLVQSLIAAIGVNTTLEGVSVAVYSDDPLQVTIDAALQDTEGRQRGRQEYGGGPMTKAARNGD